MGAKWLIAKNVTRLAIVAGAFKYCSDRGVFSSDTERGAALLTAAQTKVLPGVEYYRHELPHREDAVEAVEENWNGYVSIDRNYSGPNCGRFVRHRAAKILNFMKLCKMKYYNFCCFHSIEEGYIAQTGDPTGSGRGGESIFAVMYGEQAKYFESETVPKLKHLRRGLVSMVNNGADAHGSQFFFTLADQLDYLDASKHTVFGQVSEHFETLDRLNEALCDEQHRPYQDIRICHTLILSDPFDDPEGLAVPERSPSPSVELLKSMRLGVDEDLTDDGTKGKSAQQVEEMIAKKEAVARAHILEMIGDLHHAEEKPPDNVLFVCKLNPVTSEQDLEIIFSRFGNILSCEVIRDKISGNSLQYAFIEFETPEMCEAAYFKMDNVLIDDRRIHVDFSQSVSKNPKYVWQKLLDRNKTAAGAPAKENGKVKAGAGIDRDKDKGRDKDRSHEKDQRVNRREEPHRRRPSPPADDRRRRRRSPSPRAADRKRRRERSRDRDRDRVRQPDRDRRDRDRDRRDDRRSDHSREDKHRRR